ncbi:MAG: recombinase family protein [Leptolyngbya sp. SIO1D8]|nr:recombinase family protein [Leptolyngbya sp. SIO1D8]
MALFRLSYGRVSSLDQNIELQVSQFESIGYDELYIEKISGRRRDRPEFKRLVARALELRSQGHDVAVYVIEWTRWARDTAFSLYSLEKLEKAGVVVIEATTQKPVTMMTAAGVLDAGVKSVMAHYYSIELSERLKRSYIDRRKRQRLMGGPLPWGYVKSTDKSRFIPSKDWALCREVIERFLDGETLTGLVRWLWAEHRIKKSSAGLRRWLINPILRGHIQYIDGSILYNRHDPLISESEWSSVQYRLKLNRQLRGKNKGRIYAVPSEVVICSRCGGKASTCCNKLTRYFYCYRAAKRGDCPAPTTYCRQDWVEAAIQERISERAEAISNDLLSSESIASPAIAEKRTELEALKPLAHRPAIALEIKAIESEIVQMEAAGVVQEASSLERRQKILELAEATPTHWATLEPEERRAIYFDLVKTIEILGSEVIRVDLWD